MLGVNEYFGWYRSVAENLPDQPSTTTADLSGYLDALHAANPDLPLLITEFGAEATRSGPVEQKGTFEFQRKWVMDHLAIREAVRERLDPLGAARLPDSPDLAGRRRTSTPSRPGTTRASSRRTTTASRSSSTSRASPAHEAAPLACAAP